MYLHEYIVSENVINSDFGAIFWKKHGLYIHVALGTFQIFLYFLKMAVPWHNYNNMYKKM